MMFLRMTDREIRYVKRAPPAWWVLREGDRRGLETYHTVAEAIGVACIELGGAGGGDVVVLDHEGKVSMALAVRNGGDPDDAQ